MTGLETIGTPAVVVVADGGGKVEVLYNLLVKLDPPAATAWAFLAFQ